MVTKTNNPWHRRTKQVALTLATALFGITTALQADAIRKDLLIVPHNIIPEVSLTLDLHVLDTRKDAFIIEADDNQTAKFKDFVTFSYKASKDGYVSLWNIGSSGKVIRLLPNPYAKSMKVKAGQTYRLGEHNQKFGIRVDGPAGMEEVLMLWTKDEIYQPVHARHESFDSASVYNIDEILEVSGAALDRWATTRLSFDVSASGNPNVASYDKRIKDDAQTMRMTGLKGDVYLLSMGANTGRLQKAGADAKSFDQTMQYLLKGNVHSSLYTDAHVSDFRQGMRWLKRNAKPQDTVIVYFSGHGSTLRDQDGDEKNDKFDEVFVMADARKTKAPGEAHVIRDDEFARSINQLKTDNLIVVLDACFSAGLTKSGVGFAQGRRKFFSSGVLGQFFTMFQPNWFSDRNRMKKGVLVYAAEENQSAYEGIGGGMMTNQLLSELLNRDNRGQSLYNLVKNTGSKVNQRVNVKPAILGDANLLRRVRLAN